MHIWTGTNKMIIRRETLNTISTLTALRFSAFTISKVLNLAESDIKEAIRAFKL